MSDLPDGWEWATLGEIADTTLGKMLDRGKSTGRNLVPYLRNLNVQWGRFDLSDVSMMEIPPDQRDYFKLESGDLLVCEGGEIGRCAIWPGGTDYMAFQKALHRVRPHAGIEARYLRYLLEYLGVTNVLASVATGSTIRHLPQQQLRRLPVPVAPSVEQRRIVAAVEDYLSLIDSGIISATRAKEKSRALRHSLLDSICLGKMYIGNRRGSSSCFVDLQGRVSSKVDYSRLPGLPEGWTWRVAAEVCSSINSGSTPKSELMSPDVGEVPFLKVYNLTRDGLVDFSVRPTFISFETHENLLKRSRVVPGDVLTNIVGPPLGKTAVVPTTWKNWNINQAIVAFRAGSEVTPGWLALVLQSPYILSLLERTSKATAGQFNISLSTCRELPLPVPPIVIQREIIEGVQLIISDLGARNGLIEGIFQRGDLLRRSLLVEAFQGRLVRQDPNDEPASVLLARLKMERVAAQKSKSTRFRAEGAQK